MLLNAIKRGEPPYKHKRSLEEAIEKLSMQIGMGKWRRKPQSSPKKRQGTPKAST